jgi:putative sterol carrier protein
MQSNTQIDQRDAVSALFEQVATRGPEPSIQTVSGTLQFDIDTCGRWYVMVHGGYVTTSRNPMPASCAVACPPGDFIDVLKGKQNFMTTFLRGRVKADGDLALLLSFCRLLPVAT